MVVAEVVKVSAKEAVKVWAREAVKVSAKEAVKAEAMFQSTQVAKMVERGFYSIC